MTYKTSKETKIVYKTFVIELYNKDLQTTAITEVITETLDIPRLEQSLPENYKLVTFWIKD